METNVVINKNENPDSIEWRLETSPGRYIYANEEIDVRENIYDRFDDIEGLVSSGIGIYTGFAQ